jgi:hypothetical protein
MAYCVTAVRYNGEQLVALQVGEGDGTETGWVKQPHEVSVQDVVSRIERKDTVQALVPDEGAARKSPNLKVVDAAGQKSLALDNAPTDCLELSDLPRF